MLRRSKRRITEKEPGKRPALFNVGRRPIKNRPDGHLDGFWGNG
jgi:hypothetical protein